MYYISLLIVPFGHYGTNPRFECSSKEEMIDKMEFFVRNGYEVSVFKDDE